VFKYLVIIYWKLLYFDLKSMFCLKDLIMQRIPPFLPFIIVIKYNFNTSHLIFFIIIIDVRVQMLKIEKVTRWEKSIRIMPITRQNIRTFNGIKLSACLFYPSYFSFFVSYLPLYNWYLTRCAHIWILKVWA
jgi:hypothetical protein